MRAQGGLSSCSALDAPVGEMQGLGERCGARGATDGEARHLVRR